MNSIPKRSTVSARRRRTSKTALPKKSIRPKKLARKTPLPVPIAPSTFRMLENPPVTAGVTESERTLTSNQNKMKLWFAVGIVSVLIMIGWLYSLQYTIFQTDDSVVADLADANFDRMVQSVQADWQKLQEQAASFSTTINQTATTDTTTSAPPTTIPSTEELNNLFSDIR